jgi:hypothetical protein
MHVQQQQQTTTTTTKPLIPNKFQLCVVFFPLLLGFDDMDSIYASPDDFKSMKERDKIRGLHLLEFFVNHCHQLGVNSPHPQFYLFLDSAPVNCIRKHIAFMQNARDYSHTVEKEVTSKVSFFNDQNMHC